MPDQLPTTDSEPTESPDHHLYPENGEQHQEEKPELARKPLRDITGGAAPPLPAGVTIIADSEPTFPFAPDGRRYRLLSHKCHGSPNPDCGPTQMYVSEILAMAVFDENQLYSVHFTTHGDSAGGGFCADYEEPASDKMPPQLQEYQRDVFEFRAFQACGAGKVTVLIERTDGKVAQHHVEIFDLPGGVEQHPYVPPPIPAAEREKAERLKERFDAVLAKVGSQSFRTAIMGVSFACPAYVTSKSFEIDERLTEKHKNAGLLHVLQARKQGASNAEVWAMVKDDPEKAEDYVEIVEWGYDEFSKMIKKPDSLFGCD